MKLNWKMSENSLFAILLRSPWWISVAIGAVIGLVASAALPADFQTAGALSGFPFFVIAVLAGGREAEGAGDSKRAAELAAAEAWLAEVDG